MHGGAAPQVRKAVANRLLEGDLRKALERYGRDTPITDPLTALQQLAGRVGAWSEYLEDTVTQLRHNSQWDTEQINGVAQLFENSIREFRGILVDMAKLKIDDRLIAIEEGKVQMLFDALKAGLVAGGITGPGPTQAAFAAAGKRLRLIQGGGKRDDEDEPRKAAGY